MELVGVDIFLKRTLVVKNGDRIKQCHIYHPKRVKYAIEIPHDVNDCEVSDTIIAMIRVKDAPKTGFVFLGRGENEGVKRVIGGQQ